MSLRTKSYGVTIQMNSFQQYFHIILFALYVNPILNETSLAVLSHGTICFVNYVVLTLEVCKQNPMV